MLKSFAIASALVAGTLVAGCQGAAIAETEIGDALTITADETPADTVELIDPTDVHTIDENGVVLIPAATLDR